MSILENANWITDKRFLFHKPINYMHKELSAKEDFAHEAALQNHHMLFRNNFHIKKTDESVLINISADDYYKLYVNGEYVTQGPAPAYHFHYNYNTVDISDFIRKGENIVAVHVYYQGLVNRVWNSGDYRQGLIANIFNGHELVAVTDSTWKAYVCKAWESSKITGYATQYMEDIEANKIPYGWKLTDFDDTDWDDAVINKSDDHTMYKQITPNVSVYTINPNQMIYMTKNHIFADVGSEITGQVKMKVKGKPGDRVEIRLGEELEDKRKVRYQMRCNCDYRQYWTLAGGTDEIEFFDYLGFRYFEIILPHDSIIVGDIEIEVRHYPFDDSVYTLDSSDKVLNDVFQLCKNSVKYCAQENFVDCPTREKGQYLGDSTITAYSHMLLTGDSRLYKKMLYDFANSCVISKGMMAVAPGSLMQEIADFSCQYPQQLYTYYMHTADKETLEELYPIALGIEEWFDGYAEDDLLINKVDEKWNLVDWPQNARDGYEYDDNKPIGNCKHAVMNAFYYGLKIYNNKIRCVLDIENKYDIELLRKNFINTFFDNKRMLFKDSVGSNHSSLHANALPLYYGITPQEGVANAVELIRNKGLSCGVYFAYFVLKALAFAGEYKLVYELIVSDAANSWSTMLKEGATTCFEAWSKEQKWNTSLCHAWASAPVILIFEDMAGIKPKEPGWGHIEFKHNIPKEIVYFNLCIKLAGKKAEIVKTNGETNISLYSI